MTKRRDKLISTLLPDETGYSDRTVDTKVTNSGTMHGGNSSCPEDLRASREKVTAVVLIQLEHASSNQ